VLGAGVCRECGVRSSSLAAGRCQAVRVEEGVDAARPASGSLAAWRKHLSRLALSGRWFGSMSCTHERIWLSQPRIGGGSANVRVPRGLRLRTRLRRTAQAGVDTLDHVPSHSLSPLRQRLPPRYSPPLYVKQRERSPEWRTVIAFVQQKADRSFVQKYLAVDYQVYELAEAVFLLA
jgi:hypothetical protein